MMPLTAPNLGDRCLQDIAHDHGVTLFETTLTGWEPRTETVRADPNPARPPELRISVGRINATSERRNLAFPAALPAVVTIVLAHPALSTIPAFPFCSIAVD